jgi:hypothetical protein
MRPEVEVADLVLSWNSQQQLMVVDTMNRLDERWLDGWLVRKECSNK